MRKSLTLAGLLSIVLASCASVGPVDSMRAEGWFVFQSPAPATLGYSGIVDAEIDRGVLKTKVGIAHMYDSMLEDMLEYFEIDPDVKGFGLLKTYHLGDGRKLNVDFLLVDDFLDDSYDLEHAPWPVEGVLDVSMARFPKHVEDETDLSKVDETLTAVEYSFAYSPEENSSYLVDIDGGGSYFFERVLTYDKVVLEVSEDGFWSIVD